ncbi:hypothetical protein [Sinorhizobium terangae]|uniref:Uncharacterized protein n=1 Tax=Sinorhizobium terangae TaxID=110322 RepID=A0A6N7LCP3_SINTE|nr:hypothetical protein [Sinorhizobium terangae]MBB4183972.1 hypothetical protein [Sinorhizobium terangae]MQX15008.1 hypothetical protein [Sinorhizobium terangae]WFU48081.1 hypothetical protein QA637_01270 [Sinorhizobium terangae]
MKGLASPCLATDQAKTARNSVNRYTTLIFHIFSCNFDATKVEEGASDPRHARDFVLPASLLFRPNAPNEIKAEFTLPQRLLPKCIGSGAV